MKYEVFLLDQVE